MRRHAEIFESSTARNKNAASMWTSKVSRCLGLLIISSLLSEVSSIPSLEVFSEPSVQGSGAGDRSLHDEDNQHRREEPKDTTAQAPPPVPPQGSHGRSLAHGGGAPVNWWANEAATGLPAPPPFPPPFSTCNHSVDIVFVMDGSGSMANDVNNAREFVRSVASQLNLGDAGGSRARERAPLG